MALSSRGAPPLGLPHTLTRSRTRARIRARDLAPSGRSVNHLATPPPVGAAAHSQSPTPNSTSLSSEGLRPSDSPTRSLARARALASVRVISRPPGARSTTSLHRRPSEPQRIHNHRHRTQRHYHPRGFAPPTPPHAHSLAHARSHPCA